MIIGSEIFFGNESYYIQSCHKLSKEEWSDIVDDDDDDDDVVDELFLLNGWPTKDI